MPPARARLVVTVGGELRDRDALDWVIARGVRGFRLNFGRLTPAAHLDSSRRIRRALGGDATVFCDLPGGKARIAGLGCRARTAAVGTEVRLASVGCLHDTDVHVRGSWFVGLLRPGDMVSLGSSAVMEVETTSSGVVSGRLVRPGAIEESDALFVTSRSLEFDDLLADDRALVGAVLDTTPDFVALSFAERPRAIESLRSLIPVPGPALLAKIETRRGVAHLHELLGPADGLMVGRDDLSNELAQPAIAEVVDQVAALTRAAHKTSVTASGYFAHVAAYGKNSPEQREALALVADHVDWVVSNETSFSSHWKEIIDAAEARRAVKESSPPASAGGNRVTRIVLVRHAEAHCNVTDICAGHETCEGLTPEGTRQAIALAARLATTDDMVGAQLYSSALRRGRETAAAIRSMGSTTATENVELCGLCAQHPGSLDGSRSDVLEQAWRDDPFYAPPGGESPIAFARRVSRSLRALARDAYGGTALVVTHGGVIEASFRVFGGLERQLRIAPAHTSITEWTRAVTDDDGVPWMLSRYNDIAHLQFPISPK